MKRTGGMRGFGWTRLGILVACVLSSGCSEEASKPATPGANVTRPAAAPSPAVSPNAARSASSAAGSTSASAPEPSAEERIEAGRVTYNANCIACHSMDPTKDGALGPAVAGASLELLEARVLRAEYPEGYTPKRTTRVMVALPHLEPKLPVLAAYLDSLE